MIALAAAAVVAVLVAVVVILTSDGDESAQTPRPTTATTSARPTTSAPTSSAPPTTGAPTTPTTAPGSPSALGIAVAGGSVGTSSIRPGQSVELTASGFEPSSPVTVTLRSEPRVLGTANAAADGTFRLSVDIPSDAEPGAHRLEVSGTGADGASHVVASDITIIDTLPNTGMRRRVALTGMAVALVAFGFALVLMAGPRRRSLVGELDRVSERRGSR